MKSFSSLRLSVMAAALMLAIPAVRATDVQSTSASKASLVTEASESYDRFIVTYRDGSTERSNSNALLQNVKAAVSRAGLDRATVSSTGTQVAPLSVSYQRKLAVGADLVKTSRKLNQGEANQLIQQLATDPAVVYVQPDYKMYLIRDVAGPTAVTGQVNVQPKAVSQTVTPNDPDYATHQWDFWDPTGGANINNAWDLADGSGITVAVIDTGITKHPDLDTSLAEAGVGYDFISDSYVSGRDSDARVPGGWDLGDWTNKSPYTEDNNCQREAGSYPSSWHGTHVSGTIAALANNGTGIAGIAYNAKVLPVRALGHCGGYVSDISDAIEWASGGHVEGVPDNTHVAQVINMSLGGGGSCSANSAYGVAIGHAIQRGTTVVVAAGNSNDDAARYSPASCPGVITVSSTGKAGKRAYYSNYGSTVALAAPGGDERADGEQGGIWSTLNSGAEGPEDDSYQWYQGTSQATPHVAGTVALMLSAAQAAGLPQLTPVQIKGILTKSARPFPAVTDHPTGAGILDAYAAVNMAVNGDDNGGDPGPGQSG
jgi:serine protease